MICPYCGIEVLGRRAASHKLHCKEKPAELIEQTSKKLSEAGSKRIHTDETKKKISETRIAYLKLNPDKVPYKLNHKSKETYPEKYFKECLPGFIYQYHIEETLYHADFCNPYEKMIIEIDGEQHYVDKKMVEHDVKRTAVLEELGWKIIRIRWRDFQRLDRIDKEEIVKKLNEHKIDGFDMSTYVKPKKMNKCLDCGCDIHRNANRCIKCCGAKHIKFNLNKDELITLIKSKTTMEDVARELGVTSNSVRKRCKKFGIDFKNL